MHVPNANDRSAMSGAIVCINNLLHEEERNSVDCSVDQFSDFGNVKSSDAHLRYICLQKPAHSLRCPSIANDTSNSSGSKLRESKCKESSFISDPRSPGTPLGSSVERRKSAEDRQ